MRRFLVVFALVGLGCSDTKDGPFDPQREGLETRSCTVELTHASADEIAGDFNDWTPEPMLDEDGASVWRAELEPGAYAFSFYVDGEAEPAPPDVFTRWHDGAEVRELRVGDCQKPLWRVDELTGGERIQARLSFVAAASSKAPLDPESVSVYAGESELDDDAWSIDEDGDVVVDFTPPAPGKYSLRVEGTDTAGVAAENDGLWLPVWSEAEPFSWQDGLMYLAFTDRFRSVNGMRPSKPDVNLADIASFMGGDFDGVTEAIEDGYFDDLGVNILWLSPVYENPESAYTGSSGDLFTGYHGYWPVDPLSAESAYGGDEALHRLIKAAHARGIRVLFDIVLNHVHEDHGYCTEKPEWCAQTCVCGTENCAWEGPGGRPLDCQFAPYLPDLNYRNPEIVDRVLSDVIAKMEKFDVDGLRIDAAKHMDHVVMRQLRLRLDELEAKGVAPFYLVGETFTSDRGLIMNYVADYELHGQFDFPLYYAIRSTFARGGSFRDLEGAAAAGQRSYGQFYTWMSPFLGNHDIPRFMTEAAGNGQGSFGQTPDLMAEGPAAEVTQWDLINRASLAFVFTLTQPGVPLIYYGDEVGLAGDSDPDNRRMMPQTLNANQSELLRRVQELGQARKALPALRGAERKELWMDDSLYVYLRSDGTNVALVAMNKSDTPRTEDVTIPSAYGLSGATMEVWGRDGLEASVLNGSLRVQLNPWEYRIIVPK